jgi:undecaprenyl pyrophosphate phosphatase UppP
MKLVEDWKDAYKWLSINIAFIMALLNGLQASFAQVQAFLSPTEVAYINAALGVMVIWGRLVQQGQSK